MKTMANQDNSVVIRISEEKAKILEHEGFHYVPKAVWKEYEARKRGQSDFTPPIPKKSNKMSKSTKRHLRRKNK
tara:strand:+ start:1865 stop:2086 length:222 start_codon:yes stop_codon:yes gene_type:complete